MNTNYCHPFEYEAGQNTASVEKRTHDPGTFFSKNTMGQLQR